MRVKELKDMKRRRGNIWGGRKGSIGVERRGQM